MSTLTPDRPRLRPAPPAPGRSPSGGSGGFRTDVQGLRAVAVGLVLLYHAGLGFVPGGFVGVDVFFVISGFLITGLLLKELDRAGRISLAGFYARRARRILPAATVVLAATAAMTALLLPPTRWENIAREIAGSAFNVVNWMFAESSTDYLRNEEAASPVQHFWSLAVEEQFYLAWPLVLVGLAWLAGRARARAAADPSMHGARRLAADRAGVPHAWVALAIAAVSAGSLVHSAHLTAANPGAAYFATTTRAHELGIGAMLAVAAPALARLRAPWTGILGWGGLAAIAAAGLLFSKETAFPGTAALLPTLGAAAVIAAGLGGRDRTGAGALLSLPPMRWVGDVSYSLYLWHWPLVVVADHLLDGLTAAQGLAVVALAVLPAWLSYRYVERPIMLAPRLRPNRRALVFGAACVLTGALAAGAVAVAPAGQGLKTVDAGSLLGAEALAQDPGAADPARAVEAITPLPTEAAKDLPAPYASDCHQDSKGTEAKPCVYGDPDSDYTVAIAGDSHALHWVPALTRVAEENGWRLETYTKASCPLADGTVNLATGTPYATCPGWNANAMEALTGPGKPDLLLVSSSSHTMADGGSLADGLAATWREVKEAGVPLAVIADTPQPGVGGAECVAEHPDELAECAVPVAKAKDEGWAFQQEAGRAVGGVDVVNVRESVCPGGTCPAVVGNAMVFWDNGHLTATYSRTLAPAVERQLAELGAPVAVAGTRRG